MTIFGRYLFRQAANALLVILLTLTLVVWLATALKELSLITSQGQGILLFLQMTMLSLPSLMALIAPNAMLMAALYTLDRMNGDSELIVMTASGAPIWRIGAPIVALASIVAIVVLIANVVGDACEHAGIAQFHHPCPGGSDLASPSTRTLFQPRGRAHLPYSRPQLERRFARAPRP